MSALVKFMFLSESALVELNSAPRVLMFWMVPPEPSVVPVPVTVRPPLPPAVPVEFRMMPLLAPLTEMLWNVRPLPPISCW